MADADGDAEDEELSVGLPEGEAEEEEEGEVEAEDGADGEDEGEGVGEKWIDEAVALAEGDDEEEAVGEGEGVGVSPAEIAAQPARRTTSKGRTRMKKRGHFISVDQMKKRRSVGVFQGARLQAMATEEEEENKAGRERKGFLYCEEGAHS